MEEKPEIAAEIEEIVKKCELGDKKTISMMKRIANKALEGIKESLKQINVVIDKYVPESKFIEDGSCEKVIKKLKKTKYAGVENNAIYLDLKSFSVTGRDTRFFITRKDGTSLYATRDIAYHIWKSKQADILINVLGEDHKLESKQVEIALKLLKVKNLPKVIFYAFVSLPEGRMSTRRGRVVYLDDLIAESLDRAYEEVKKRRGRELSDEKMKEIARIVGIGAIRYNIVKVQPEKEIVFRWEDALNFEGESAPFIQYAHARANSILRKAGETEEYDFNASLLRHPSEIKLVKILSQLPIKMKLAYETCRPNVIANYAYNIAVQFNQFYRDCPVIDSEEEVKKARLSLVKATKIVLKNTLDLIGIEAPEEM
jgi:arginyl-tRNA synthetase